MYSYINHDFRGTHIRLWGWGAQIVAEHACGTLHADIGEQNANNIQQNKMSLMLLHCAMYSRRTLDVTHVMAKRMTQKPTKNKNEWVECGTATSPQNEPNTLPPPANAFSAIDTSFECGRKQSVCLNGLVLVGERYWRKWNCVPERIHWPIGTIRLHEIQTNRDAWCTMATATTEREHKLFNNRVASRRAYRHHVQIVNHIRRSVCSVDLIAGAHTHTHKTNENAMSFLSNVCILLERHIDSDMITWQQLARSDHCLVREHCLPPPEPDAAAALTSNKEIHISTQPGRHELWGGDV